MSGKHKRLAASQTKWWSNCPGALAYVEAHPESEKGSNEYAQMGTCAHALVETCLSKGHEPDGYLGRLIEITNPDTEEEGTSILRKGAKWPKDPTRVVFEADADMVDAVTKMTDYVRWRLAEEGLDMRHVRLETRTNPLPIRDDTGGTADVVIDAWPILLEIIDYKNGSGVFVPVEGNEQLRSYGLGELYGPGGLDYERVRHTICQPRHQQSPSDGIMSEEMDPQDLWDWGGWLALRAERVDDARELVAGMAEPKGNLDIDLATLNAGGFLSVGDDGSHCTWCPLSAACPAALARVQELAMTDFDDDPLEIDVPASDNHLAVLVPWIPFVDKWAKGVMANAKAILMAGGKIDGQKVVRGISNRKWTDEMDEEDIGETLKADYGLSADVIRTVPKLITGPQAEKLIEKDRRKEFNEHLLVKPEGALTMAPESDKRDAVTVDPADDFDDPED